VSILDVIHPLAASARARPKHLALVTQDQSLTYEQLLMAVQALATRLLEQGVKEGSRVILVGPPSARWVIAFFAIGWLGAVVVPVAPASSKERLHSIANDLDGVLTLRSESVAWHESQTLAPEPCWRLDQERVVVMTSGSTAQPTPVSLSTGQMMFSALGSALRLGHLPQDRWLACLPLHHVGGLSILFRCALYSTTIVLQSSFEAAAVNKAIDDGCSLLSLVPVMLQDLLDARGSQALPSSLRVILVGGAPMPPALLARCRALGAPVALSWGMTETGSQVATRYPGDLASVSAPPLAVAQVRQRGDRLEISGPLVPEPCFVAQDLGRVDERGQVHVTGRADRVLISGGENISLAEVQRMLKAAPGVVQAVVFSVPDERWGERPCAAVVGGLLGEEALREWCKERLQPFQVPDRILLLAELPTNAMGKTSIEALRSLL
jgi:O-succinylbenzoic acid--CoA ligase